MFLTEYCEACSNIFKTAKECFKLSDERKAKIKKKKKLLEPAIYHIAGFLNS